MMDFKSYMEEQKETGDHSNGTYMAYYLDDISKNLISLWNKQNKIPNATEPDELHTTVVYSKVPVPALEYHDFELPIVGELKNKFELFDYGPHDKCLVVIVNSEDLHDQHNTVHQKYGAHYKFPEYIPHITLSPKVPHDFDITKLTPLNMIVKYSKHKVNPIEEN